MNASLIRTRLLEPTSRHILIQLQQHEQHVAIAAQTAVTAATHAQNIQSHLYMHVHHLPAEERVESSEDEPEAELPLHESSNISAMQDLDGTISPIYGSTKDSPAQSTPKKK